MLGSITRACARQGYDLLISFQQASGDWHAEYQDSHKADGLILLGYGDYLESQHKLKKLVDQGTHFVRWGAVMEGQPGLSVGCDNFHGGQEATQHLLALGRRRIAFLGSASGHYPEFLERYRGYGAALEAAGVSLSPALQVDAITMEQSGYEAARELLARGESFDAIVAASDLIALGAIRALRELGRDVPRDVSVVGYDNNLLSRLSTPTLSTVQQDIPKAGRMLVSKLLDWTGDPRPELLSTELIIRESCGA